MSMEVTYTLRETELGTIFIKEEKAMENQNIVLVGGLYRHFKGDYYVVNKIAILESNKDEALVIYTSVSKGNTWARPYKEFFDDVSKREDNTTHQVHRFEVATEIKGLLGLTPTHELVDELKTRPDNPYEGFKTLEEDEDVWSVQYLLGRVVEHPATQTEEAYEEFVPITPQAFETIEAAKKYRETFYVNRPCVIARRVTKKVSEF